MRVIKVLMILSCILVLLFIYCSLVVAKISDNVMEDDDWQE